MSKPATSKYRTRGGSLPRLVRPRVTYQSRKDGEGWAQKSGEVFKLECCDCGLVHRIVIMAGKPGGLIGIAASRDNRATAQRRRHRANADGEARADNAIPPQNQTL
jgi:hypothetical protein